MTQQTDLRTEASAVTEAIAARAASLRPDDLTSDTIKVAKHCLLDWFAVALAGMQEPLSAILLKEAAEEGGAPQATIMGLGADGSAAKGTVAQAALIHGSASHALDFDDVNMTLSGHPTVPVAPVVLALAEHRGLTGRDVVTAFVAGYETECRIGALVGPSHYKAGFHATGTIGCFGAAAAAAHLLGLDAATTAVALGIAGTQSAGLKSQFGTMCKPLHAGKAAVNGLLAARLAARGFTGRPDILEANLGFAKTMSADLDAERALSEPPYGFHIHDNLFKYHAACYLTHSTIDAVRRLADDNDIAADQVAGIRLHVDPGHFDVCHIAEPTTGLQVKFSLRHTAAMALAGVDTGRFESYSDATANRADLVALRRCVEVSPDGGPGTEARVEMTTNDGGQFSMTYDVGVPSRDLPDQERRLIGKFNGLVEPLLGSSASDRLRQRILSLESLDTIGCLHDDIVRLSRDAA